MAIANKSDGSIEISGDGTLTENRQLPLEPLEENRQLRLEPLEDEADSKKLIRRDTRPTPQKTDSILRKDPPLIQSVSFSEDATNSSRKKTMRAEPPAFRNEKANQWLSRDPAPITVTHPPHSPLKRKWMRNDPPPMATVNSDGSIAMLRRQEAEEDGSPQMRGLRRRSVNVAGSIEDEASASDNVDSVLAPERTTLDSLEDGVTDLGSEKVHQRTEKRLRRE